MVYITDIQLIYFSGVKKSVKQFIAPLGGMDMLNLKNIVLTCSDGSVITYIYNKDNIFDFDRYDYASVFYKRNKNLFGHVNDDEYYYFVAYSDIQISIYNSFNRSTEYKEIHPDVHTGYVSWASEENKWLHSTKLIAYNIINGVIMPFQHSTPDSKVYNFNYLNIVEVLIKCILEKKSAYVRVGKYDSYVSKNFSFKGALLYKDIPDKKYLMIKLVSFDSGTEETYNKFLLKKEEYDTFRSRLVKYKLAGLI